MRMRTASFSVENTSMDENGGPDLNSDGAGTSERETDVVLDNENAGCRPATERDEAEGNDGKEFSYSDVDQAAVLQLTFNSIDDAEKFYVAYATFAGFRIRTHCAQSRNKEWVCNREGFRKTPKEGYYGKRGPKPETRCGCKASFRVARDRVSGKFRVTRFEPNHNHPLESGKKSTYLPPSLDKSMLTLMTDDGYRPCQAMNILEKLAGGPGKISLRKKDGTSNTGDLKRKSPQDEDNSSQSPNTSSLKRTKHAESNGASTPVDASKPQKALKLEHRTSLQKMVEINIRLQKPQIEAIEELGFGSITRIQFDRIDRMLVRWLLECYDPDNSCLSIHGHRLTVDDEAIYRAIGIPKAGVKPTLSFTSSEGLIKYETLFNVIEGRIDLSDLFEKLKVHDGCGEDFKVMYLTLVLGVVLFPCIHQNLPVHYLDLLVDLRKLKHINWAGLVRESIDNGVRLWKEKTNSYVGGCILFFQVFFLARVRPQGSPHFIRLNCEIPYVDHLTKQRVTLLTTDMQKKGGYMNPKACCLEDPKNPYYCPMTLIQAKDPKEPVGMMQVPYFERAFYARRVGDERLAWHWDPRSNKPNGPGQEDKGIASATENRVSSGDGEAMPMTGVVQLDQGKNSSVPPPTDSKTVEDLQNKENLQPDVECDPDAVASTEATKVDSEKTTMEKSTVPSTEGKGTNFLLQSQVTLLSARVLALETQCTQLMNILNDLLSRQMNEGGGQSNPLGTSVGPLTKTATTIQKYTTNIP